MFDVFRTDLTVYRKSTGSYVKGRWQEGSSETSFTIKASVQGMDAEILLTLPEGYRTREGYTLFTDIKLRTAIIGKSNPDIVMIDEERYQVIKVTAHQNLNYPTAHYEVLVIRENIDAN